MEVTEIKSLVKMALSICFIVMLSFVGVATAEESLEFIGKIPAQQWYVNQSTNIVIDSSDNIYVADTGKDHIDEINPSSVKY